LKITENKSDAEQSKVIDQKPKATTVDETKIAEKEPVVELNQTKEEVVETKEEVEASNAEEIIAGESNSIVNPATEVVDKVKEKAGGTIAGITASAAALAGGLGLATGENATAEPTAPESLPDVSTATEVKESVEAAIENPTSAAATAISDGLGLTDSANDSIEEPLASESLPDAATATEMKESIKEETKNPVSVAEVTDEAIQATEDVKEANKEEE